MKNRSVIEIMILSFTFVISLSIISLGVTVAILEIRNPGADTKGASTALFNLLSGMTGALVGLLAAKAEVRSFTPPELPPDKPTETTVL